VSPYSIQAPRQTQIQMPKQGNLHWTAIASLCFCLITVLSFSGFLYYQFVVPDYLSQKIYLSALLIMLVFLSPLIATILAQAAQTYAQQSSWRKTRWPASLAAKVAAGLILLEIVGPLLFFLTLAIRSL
jgi:hypothetical protein